MLLLHWRCRFAGLLLEFECCWWVYRHVFFKINLLTQPVFVESQLGTRLGSRSCRHSIQVRGAQVSRELTFWERGTMQAQRRDRCLEEKNKWGRGLEHEYMGREGCCVCSWLVRNCLCDKTWFKWRPGTREVPKGVVML